MINNQYLESFKINMVKQYLNGKEKKKICEEFNISESTMWGWICKYRHLIEKEWCIKGLTVNNEEFIDLTKPVKDSIRKENIVYTSNSSVRIFKNGYSIICDITRLKEVIEVIAND